MLECNCIEKCEWRDIPSVPGYKASFCGMIARVVPTSRNRKTPFIHRYAIPPGKKYDQKTLNVDGGSRTYLTHRLVCEAFHGQPTQEQTCACHCDGNPRNNRADNLRWDTAKNNIADMVKHGTRATGEDHPNSVITKQIAQSIRNEYQKKYGEQTRLAKKYGITQSSVWLIVNNKTRNELTR